MQMLHHEEQSSTTDKFTSNDLGVYMSSQLYSNIKIVYVLLDGVGDLPHPSLNYLTPLEGSVYTIYGLA